MHQSLAVAALGLGSVLLQGCSFSTVSEICDGDTCSCYTTLHSFEARLSISGVPLEHSSRNYYIPAVAKDVANASFAPCCLAIRDQIKFDIGKSASSPNHTESSFGTSCNSSPNKEVASAATISNGAKFVSGATARKLNGLRKLSPLQVAHSNSDSKDNLPSGLDCEVKINGFPLNTVNISSGSMMLKVKWVDPDGKERPCCEALTKVIQKVYLEGVHEFNLTKEVRDPFCSSCKWSPNQGVALAAYRCFGTPTAKAVDAVV